jgi:hypothetical protein
MGNSLDNYKEHRNQKDGEGSSEEHASYGHRPYQTARLSAGT